MTKDGVPKWEAQLVAGSAGLRVLNELVRLETSPRWHCHDPRPSDPNSRSVTAVVSGGPMARLLGRCMATACPRSDVGLLLDALRARGRPVTLLADALDEAQEPIAIAGGILRRIAALPSGRVVVGTRASTDEDPDEPDAGHRNLLDALGPHATVMVERDPAAMSTYVTRRLTAAHAGHKLNESDAAIHKVASLVAGSDRQFLFARLAIHEILARPGVLDPSRRDELVTLLSGDHRSLFAVAVNRLAAVSPASITASACRYSVGYTLLRLFVICTLD